jgi:glyoxylase-like metal-dependent hydrolase (beta-lactamase superfamily II)
MFIRQLFESTTSTYTYLVADEKSGNAALIDPVIETIERDLQLVDELGLQLLYVLDTHVHADHVTAAGEIRSRTGATVVGSPLGAACVDLKVKEGATLKLGEVEILVLETPGHTDDSLSYVVGDNVFTGDTLLIRGTGRTDFQNGDAGQLYRSITEKLFALPGETKVWPGHDYKGHTSSTIAEEKRLNPRAANKSREEFVAILDGLGLPRPAKIDIAVPANRRCGLSEERALS